MNVLPKPTSELRELLHLQHTEVHQVVKESRREIARRLHFVRHLLIDIEDLTKLQTKEKKAGLCFSNISDSWLKELLDATLIHSQAIICEINRVNRSVKSSIDN